MYENESLDFAAGPGRNVWPGIYNEYNTYMHTHIQDKSPNQ